MKDTGLEKKLEAFQKMLNKQPPNDAIKEHRQVKYLPISYHESTMDRLFFGLWSSEVVQSIRELNEITCVVKVTYTHPVTGRDYCKTGVASVQIMQESNTKITDFAMHKKPNALQTCLPKARAEAFKNATQQIGKIFGRDLGRKNDAVTDYSPLLNGRETNERKGFLLLTQSEINSKISVDALNEYMRENPQLLSDFDALKMYEEKLLSLPPAKDE